MATVTTTFFLDSATPEYSAWAKVAGSSSTWSQDTATADADSLGTIGSAKIRTSGKNKTDTNTMTWTGLWSELGVPNGCTVTNVTVSYYYRCTEFATALTSTDGPFEVLDSDNNVLATPLTGRTYAATNASFTQRTSGSTALSTNQYVTSTVKLKLTEVCVTGNSNSGAVSMLIDKIAITCTYTTSSSTITITDNQIVSVVSSSWTPFAGGQCHLDRTQNGNLWVFAALSTSASNLGIQSYYSSNGGSTWNTGTFIGSSTTGGAISSYCSAFIDLDDFLHIAFQDSVSGNLVYRRGTPNAGRTAWTMSSPTTVGTPTNGTARFGSIDIVAFRTPGTSPQEWDVVIVCAHGESGTGFYSLYERLHIANAGTVTADNYDGFTAQNGMGKMLAGTALADNCVASVDFYHTDDYKTVLEDTPHIWVGYSKGGTALIAMKKLTYSAGSWSAGTEVVLSSGGSNDWAPGGTISGPTLYFEPGIAKVMYAGSRYSGTAATGRQAFAYFRDIDDTTTTSINMSGTITNWVEDNGVLTGHLGYCTISTQSRYLPDPYGNLYVFTSVNDTSVSSVTYRYYDNQYEIFYPAILAKTNANTSSSLSVGRKTNTRDIIEFVYCEYDGTNTKPHYVSVALNQNIYDYPQAQPKSILRTTVPPVRAVTR